MNMQSLLTLRSYILLWIFLISIFLTTNAQKNCNALQDPSLLKDGDVIRLTQKCIINMTNIITLNNMNLKIEGQSNQIDFITNQQYLFHLSHGSSLILEHLEIESPTKHRATQIKSIFYVSNASNLTLNAVQFTNNIINTDHYLYTQYIIYSPQSDISSSITIKDSSFDTNFAITKNTIYVTGTEDMDQCPFNAPCCKSQILITNTVYNKISKSFLTAFCSEIAIIQSNITNNNITDDCLFCFGFNTITTMNDNIFDGNNGVMVYSSYSDEINGAGTSNNIFDLIMTDNTINNQQNTGIILQSNTLYPSEIIISNILVQNSIFGSNGFIILYPNTNSNIKIIDSNFNDNNGTLITSQTSSSMVDIDSFNNCLNEYNNLEIGAWIISTTFNNNNAGNDIMFDIQYQRLAIDQITLTNNQWAASSSSSFQISKSSLSVFDTQTINGNTDDSFNGVFSFNSANSLCFNPDFMFFAFGVNAASFSIDDLFTFTNTIDVKGVGISDIELNDCNPSTSTLNPSNVQYIKFSHFNATNCPLISIPVSRNDANDNGVTIDFYDGIFKNSSIALNLHLNDKITMTNCHFYASFIELSSGMLSNNATMDVSYGILDTNVVIENCDFEGNLKTNELIQIYAKDEWLPSITFLSTDFYDLSRDIDDYLNPLIIISTSMIATKANNDTNDELPFGQSAIRFIDCNFNSIHSHILTVEDDAIFSNTAPISRVYFEECKFENLNSTVIYDDFRKQAAIKFDFMYNLFDNITALTDNAVNADIAMLHFHGFDCIHTESQLLDNDISFTEDIFQFIESDRSIIHGSCINLGLTKVLIDNNNAFIAYGVSLTKSNLILSSVIMQNNMDSIYGGIYCYTENNDITSCNIQIINSQFIGNEAMYGGAISFKTSEQTVTEYASIRIYSTNFMDNIASNFGGAIFIEDVISPNDEVIIEFYDVNFNNNEAMVGGAIYMEESDINCKNCQFINNTASQYGGAMVMKSSICMDENTRDHLTKYPKLILEGGTNIINNDALIGGGLALICYHLYTNNVLYNNNGRYSSYRGGAIFAHKTCLHSITNNTFSYNDAEFGGAMAISAPLAIGCINNMTQNIFRDNIGRDQTGGILISTSYIDVSDYNMPPNNEFNLTFPYFWFNDTNHTLWRFEIYNNIFDSNRGGNHGGAILISPADFIERKVIITPSPTVSNQTINDTNSTLSPNNDDDDDDDIYRFVGIANNYEINIFDNRFTENEISDAQSDNYHGGGAIAWLLDANSSARVNIFDCNFTENKGNKGQGGAIWVSCYECTYQEEEFPYYSASYNITRKDSCEYCSYITYYTNDAILDIHDLNFKGNEASAGGAIAVTCIGNLDIYDITFTTQSAEFYGGSIYLHQLGVVKIDNVLIQNTNTKISNYVDSKGGGIYGSCILDNILIINTKISNAKSVIGGAVFLYETPTIYVNASSFTNNEAVLAGGCLSIFTPGINERSISISDVNFTENNGSPLGSTIYIGSYRDIILMFDGHSDSVKDEWYPPLLDVWDFLYVDKRRIFKTTEKEFTFTNQKYDSCLSISRIIVDIDILDKQFAFSGTPQWNETDAYLYDAAGTLQASIDFERSFGNVIFLQDAYFEDNTSKIITADVDQDYLFSFNGERWTQSMDKNTSKNITFEWDMIALIENENADDTGSIDVIIEDCFFRQNGEYMEDKVDTNVIGNVYIDDPFGIATVISRHNDFISNVGKVGSSLVHLSGYSNQENDNPIDLSSNKDDIVTDCTFIDNLATDTGNIVIQNADLTFIDSICESNLVGLDGSCIATYSSTLNISNVVIVNSITQVSGAIYSDLSIVRIQDANFTNNVANFGDGSCLYAKRMIPLILGSCPPFTFELNYNEFSNNDTNTHQNYLFSVVDCFFYSNKAYNGSGGAIYIGTDYDKHLLFDNSTCTDYITRYEENNNNIIRRRRLLLQFNDTNTSITTTSIPMINTTQFFQPTTPSPTTVDCINIDIIPDVHISDISWTLKGLDLNGSVTVEGNGIGIPSICLNNSNNDTCLEFTIYDSFGDGLSYGQGTWDIIWYGEEWSSPSNGNYYNNETLQFCKSSVYEDEIPAVIDIVVSIIDDADCLDFIMAFLDDIVPKFENRIEANLIFTNIANRDINDLYPFDNVNQECIGNEKQKNRYCSPYGNEAIIDALAVLCIWNSANDTLLDDFQDFWGDSNNTLSSVAANESASFEFLNDYCDLVEIEYNYDDKSYTLLSGVDLLNQSFQLFDKNYIDNDDENVPMPVPQIDGVQIISLNSWISIWDYNTQSVCQFYNANPNVIELICDYVEFNINIKPPICQYQSCISQECTADDAKIIYNSISQGFFEEDAISKPYDTGPNEYEIIDLEFIVIGEFSLDTQCFEGYVINETEVENKGVLIFTNSSCNHDTFIFRLQNAGVRAVIIGENIAIPHTDSPTLSPTKAPTITEIDRLHIFLNATLDGMNITHFTNNLSKFIKILNTSLLVPVDVSSYHSGSSSNQTKMEIFLDSTNADEIWSSLRSDGATMYLQLLQWSIEFGINQQIAPSAQFVFDPNEMDFARISPTPPPTPAPTSIPTVAPTVQTIFIPIRVLHTSSGRKFAEAAYFMSILNYTNDDPYDLIIEGTKYPTTSDGISKSPTPSPTEDISPTATPIMVNDMRVSFICNITLPTPQPTPQPTQPDIDGKNETKVYLSDEISIYGYNSQIIENNIHPSPEWIVSLSKYINNATCAFKDEKDDKKDVNDTSQCKPRLNDLYDKCLMQFTIDSDGAYIQKRNAQIDTIISPVDQLCIYRNIEENAGFLVPAEDDIDFIDLKYGKESALELIFEEISEDDQDRPCQSKYKDGNGLINVNNLVMGTYCFFIDKDDNNYKLIIKHVYRWNKAFMQIYDSHFLENFAKKDGGAIVISADSGFIGDYSSMIISHCSFLKNNASSGLGGAIYKSSAVDDTINNVMSILQIENITDNMFNEAGYGGGSIAIKSPAISTNIWRTVVFINNIDFENNFAIKYGGGIYSHWGNIYILDSSFERNMVLQSGGAIYLINSGFGVLNTDFLYNEAINISSQYDQSLDKDIKFEYDNDGGAIYSSFYNDSYSNPPCVGIYSVYFQNNTAGNTGGAMWLGLYGDEAKFGSSCIKLSNIKFGNHTYRGGTANKAYDGGRSIFLNVTQGLHSILFGDTSITALCFTASNLCKQFESTVYHLCVQEYEVAAGVCNVRINELINSGSDKWVETIINVSLAGNEDIEMFPGDSKMFQVFGWDVYGNLLYPNEWSIDLSTKSDVIDLTETIESPVFDSWLFPLFTQAAVVNDSGTGKIFDLNGVATDLIINIIIVNCSDGYQYDEYPGEGPTIFTCTPCSAGTYIMNSNPCTACDLGLECLGTNNVKIAQYWYGKPQTDGLMALQLCPPGVCCSNPNGCFFYDKITLCSYNRDSESPLCGKCIDGKSETSSSSGACGECGPESPLIFILPGLAGFLMVIFYLKRLSKPKQDIPHPLVSYISRSALFVFQLLPTLTFQSSAAIFEPIAALANFEIDFSSSGGAGTCYLQNMGPRDKIGVGLVPSFIFLGQLLLLYIIYFIKTRFKPSSKWTLKDSSKWNLSFFQTFWQLAIMLYAKVTISLLKLTDCRSVGEYGTVMWYAGSIKCWDEYHGVAWFFLSLMFLTPFGVVYILRREYLKHNGDTGKGWKYLRKRYPALVMPYRRKRYWYSAWNLARRFILIGIASLPTKRPDYSATALAVVVGFVLGIHVFARPFYHEINNKLETFALFCAFGVSILNIMLNKPAFYSTITAILAMAPLAPIPFLMYKFATSKAPFTVAIIDEDLSKETGIERGVDDVEGPPQWGTTPSFGKSQTIRRRQRAGNDTVTLRQLTIKKAKSIREKEKKQDASWKSMYISRGKRLHLIRKIDLEEEVGADAKNLKKKNIVKGKKGDKEDSEFYPSHDDRSWSGRWEGSQIEYTEDEDFINEELDDRSLWAVITGKKIEKDDDSDSDLDDDDEERSHSSLADNELNVAYNDEYWTAKQRDGDDDDDDVDDDSKDKKDDDDDDKKNKEVDDEGFHSSDSDNYKYEISDDYTNDYYKYKESKDVKTYFGGKLRLKQGLKEKKKIAKQQREMVAAAEKKKQKLDKRQLRKLRRSGLDQGSPISPRQRKNGGRYGQENDEYFEDYDSGGEYEGDDGTTTSSPFRGIGQSIELHRRYKRTNTGAAFEEDEVYVDSIDPFEIERKEAAKKRRERIIRKRKKAAEEKKKREEEAVKSQKERLDDLWGDTDDVGSVDTLSKVGPNAKEYLEKLADDESSEDDIIPANELLDDGGAAIIQQSIITTMNGILDIAFGADIDSDNDTDLADIINIDNIDNIHDNDDDDDDDDDDDNKHITGIPSGSLDTETNKAFHLVLGSDLTDVDAQIALKKTISPNTKQLIKNLEEMDEDIMDQEVMDMAMEIQDDDDDDDDDDEKEENKHQIQDSEVAFDDNVINDILNISDDV